MKFESTPLEGVYLLQPQVFGDDRGFFTETWNDQTFREAGFDWQFVQDNHSRSAGGTLRGMHFQTTPFAEAKLVRCTRGALFDVIIDLRSDSPTFTHNFSVVLSVENRRMLYVPERFAHGFQTLEDNTEIAYQMSCAYSPEHGRGVRWNDPAFGIDWPNPKPIINQRDAAYPDFEH